MYILCKRNSFVASVPTPIFLLLSISVQHFATGSVDLFRNSFMITRVYRIIFKTTRNAISFEYRDRYSCFRCFRRFRCFRPVEPMYTKPGTRKTYRSSKYDVTFQCLLLSPYHRYLRLRVTFSFVSIKSSFIPNRKVSDKLR